MEQSLPRIGDAHHVAHASAAYVRDYVMWDNRCTAQRTLDQDQDRGRYDHASCYRILRNEVRQKGNGCDSALWQEVDDDS